MVRGFLAVVAEDVKSISAVFGLIACKEQSNLHRDLLATKGLRLKTEIFIGDKKRKAVINLLRGDLAFRWA